MANNFRRTVHHSLQIDIASGTKTIQNTPSVTPEPWPPAPGATFELDFTTGTFPSPVTFSRASSATLVNSNGYVAYAPNNQILWSNKFDETPTWVSQNVTVAQSGTTPNGFSAWEMTVLSTPQILYQNFSGIYTPRSVFSIYCKKNVGIPNLWLWLRTSGVSYVGVNFNMDTGAWEESWTVVSHPAIQPTNFEAISLGNGWYRISVVTHNNNFNNMQVFQGDQSYSVSIGDSCFISSIQFENDLSATLPSEYKSTTDTVYEAPRIDYNPATLVCKGLLIEEQRTNNILYSQDFTNVWSSYFNVSVTPNDTISPDGTTNASKLESFTGSDSLLVQNVSVATTNYAYSLYAKANSLNWVFLQVSDQVANAVGYFFNISTGIVGSKSLVGTAYDASSPTITPVGNGWYRISYILSASVSIPIFTITLAYANNDTSTISAGDSIYIWGAQVEEGAFATSYIPTTSTATTREQDIATVTGTNFSSWYNANVGTFLSQFDGPALGNRSILTADDNTVNDSINLATSGTSGKFIVKDGGVTQVDLTAGTVAASTQYKIAGAYQLNNFATSLAGGAAVTDTNGTIPTVDRMQIGFDPSGNYINGHIASIKYWNIKLNDSTIQALTT